MPAPKMKRMLKQMQAVEEDVLTLARARIRHAYSLFDHMAVAFSGGKDSTVVFNLALEAARELGRTPLHVYFFDEEAIPCQVEEYMRRVAAQADVRLEWYTVPIKHRNACSKEQPYWFPWAQEDEPLWCRPMPPEGIRQLDGYTPEIPSERRAIPALQGLVTPPYKYGNVGVFMGIRAKESLIRFGAVANRREENYIVHHTRGFKDTEGLINFGNVWKVYPIYDWDVDDVWLAPASMGWDYCRIYDLWEMAGIPHANQRLAPPFGEEPMQKLWIYKQVAPELWAKMVYRVKGAATAARYSTTALYSFNEALVKPEGMTNEQFVQQLLQKHDPKTRAMIAKRIKQDINSHYKRTKDPILPTAPHPLTFISWHYLATVADRGDLKRRRVPSQGKHSDTESRRKIIAAYEAEREVWEAELLANKEGLAEAGTRF